MIPLTKDLILIDIVLTIAFVGNEVFRNKNRRCYKLQLIQTEVVFSYIRGF